MTPLLDARDVSFAERLLPLNLTSGGGQMIALVGPNGGGKTSLLRALAQVEGASGTVIIDGQDIKALGEIRRRRLLSFLPASRDIAWPIAVRDVIALGLSRRDDRRVADLIDELGLGLLADRPISALSTGERARALLARALAAKPRLLLLDEPLSNLDPYWVLRTLQLLTGAAQASAAVFVAVHDIVLIDHFDRILLLDRGNIIGDGTPSAMRDRVGDLFGVEPNPTGGWRINSSAGPRSSP